MVIQYFTMGGDSILQSGSSATIPTNSPELKEEILEGGTVNSNCLERLIEVSPLLIERLSLSCIIFQIGQTIVLQYQQLPVH